MKFKILFSIIVLLAHCTSMYGQEQSDKISLYFPTNGYELNAASINTLELNIPVLNVDSIYVYAFCDNRGSEAFNLALSEKRKDAVLAWLKSSPTVNGLPYTINSRSFGELKPLNRNRNELDWKLNRRVDVMWTFKQPIAKKEVAPIKSIGIQKDTAKVNLKEQIENSKKSGASLVLPNINFIGGRDEFREESYESLRELLNIMKEQTDLKIEIQGHVCCTDGRDGPNILTGKGNLSEDRAKAVFDYLVRNGIAEKRMRYKGFAGMKKLVEPELSESDQQKNRRVEIQVLSN
jgi:outer membrane protein OmpA-like peptidoglycan-associated protein